VSPGARVSVSCPNTLHDSFETCVCRDKNEKAVSSNPPAVAESDEYTAMFGPLPVFAEIVYLSYRIVPVTSLNSHPVVYLDIHRELHRTSRYTRNPWKDTVNVGRNAVVSARQISDG
jgi:hypothetical protein